MFAYNVQRARSYSSYIVISQDHIKWQTALFAILSSQKVSAHTPAAAGVTAAAPAAAARRANQAYEMKLIPN
jgi:hypothetical protein